MLKDTNAINAMLYMLFRMQIAYTSILKYERGSLVSTLQSFVEKKSDSFTFMFKGTLFLSYGDECDRHLYSYQSQVCVNSF